MENKREYISETLETPVSGEYDVIVAGAMTSRLRFGYKCGEMRHVGIAD